MKKITVLLLFALMILFCGCIQITIAEPTPKPTKVPARTPVQTMELTPSPTPYHSATYENYEIACNLSVEDIDVFSMPGILSSDYYSYGDLQITSVDIEWITSSLNKYDTVENGALYRSLSLVMFAFEPEFSYDGGYEDWIGLYFPIIFRGSAPDTAANFAPYHEKALPLFSLRSDSATTIFKALATSPYFTSPSNDFSVSNFSNIDASISDLTGTAKYFGITEKALGYIIADLSEYGFYINFDGNTCTIKG